MTLHRLVLAGALLLACALPAGAQNARVVSGCALSATLPLRDAAGLMVDENGKLCINGGGGGSGGAVAQGAAASDIPANRWPVLAYQGGAWTFGLTGAIPAGSNAIGFVGTYGLNKTGFQQQFGVDARGSLIAPNAGAANRQITKCSIAATSATLTCTINNGTAVSSPAGICPAVTDAVVTELRSSAASIGLGLSGQALITATDGTGAGTPDMVLPAANTLYTMPVSATNAITAYNPGASAAITTCIQTLRQ